MKNKVVSTASFVPPDFIIGGQKPEEHSDDSWCVAVTEASIRQPWELMTFPTPSLCSAHRISRLQVNPEGPLAGAYRHSDSSAFLAGVPLRDPSP